MRRIILLIALIAAVVSSCIKMPKYDPNLPENQSALKIPSTFDWKTIKEIKVTVAVTTIDAQSKDKLHIIKIYNSPLLNSGSLITSGTATPNKPFNVALSVASITDKLYVYEMKPNGVATVTTQEVSSATININLTNDIAEMPTKSNAFIASNVMNPSPVISTPNNYDVTIIDNNALTLTGFAATESSAYGNTYKSYYIPNGFTRTANINFGNWLAHSILFVKGTLTINSNVELNKCSIVILDGGTVNVDKLSNGGSVWPISYIDIHSGGKLNVSKTMNVNNAAIVVNKGTLTSKETIDVNGGSTIYNEGTIEITKSNKSLSITNSSALYNSGIINTPKMDFTVNTTGVNDLSGVINSDSFYFTNGSVINNYGEIVAVDKFTNAGGGTLNNFCRITANLSDVQAITANLKTGSIWSSQNFKVNNSTINMDGGSMFVTANISDVYGMKVNSTSPTFALIKNTGDMPDLRWAASEVKGNIEFVHSKLVSGSGANGRDLYEATFSNGAILSKTQTKNIPGTTCNQSLGQIDPGTPPVDPGTEFTTYFPSQSGWATYAFEDLWPFKGDYDLNDMVLNFRVSIVSNSSNKVTKLIFDYTILAVGATKIPAVAFQLDNVPAANIGSVTGQVLGSGFPFSATANGTEGGIALAVIPVFNNPRDIVPFPVFLNTEKNREHIIAPTKQIVVTLSTPVNQSQITMQSFNLFLSTDERGKEIHLPAYTPTTKFNPLLVMGKPISSSDVFKSYDGMMWGLMFPDSFAYPMESASIISAYTHFAEWATSGGTSYQNWYSNEAGYRDLELIY